MAELVKQENDLVAIKVYLDPDTPSAGPPSVRLDVERAGVPRDSFAVEARELGISEPFDPGHFRYGEPPWRIPSGLLGNLRNAVERAAEGEPLPAVWLHVASPAGYLAMVPWERVLGSAFDVPIMRVPHFAMFPAFDDAEVDVAVCVTQPLAKGRFDAAAAARAVTDQTLAALPAMRTVHIFADKATYDELRGTGVERHGPDGTVRLYDPELAPAADHARGRGEIDDSPNFTWNPWLHWIAHETRDRTLEIVHFIGHAYLARDQAALAVSESPLTNTDERWARFIGPRQLSAFLDLVGAWAMGFSSPRMQFSPMGARLLVDDIAHRHAGPVIHHDLDSDPDAGGLRAIWSAIVDRSWPTGPSDLEFYGHPRLFTDTSAGDSVPYAQSLLADPPIGRVDLGAAADVSTEPWVTLTRRYLEQSAARLFPGVEAPTSAAELAAAEGVRQALSFVSRVVATVGSDQGGADRPVGRRDKPEGPA